MGSQSGTNCDAPYHFDAGGQPIDQVPLERFIGPAVIIDVRGKPPRTPIGLADVQRHLADVGPDTVVLLHTGWPAHYGTAAYFDHPFLDQEACRALLDRGALTFCLDTPSIDETPDDAHPGDGFPVHHLIAQAGGVIVENLSGIERIDFAPALIAVFPLRLTGADGSPARAVAIDLQI